MESFFLDRLIYYFLLVVYISVNTGILLALTPFRAVVAEADEPKQTKTAQENTKEVVSLRTENSKTFSEGFDENGSEIYKMVVSSDKIHYKSGDNWSEINNNLAPINDGKYAYKNIANEFDFKVGEDLETGVQFSHEGKFCEFRLDKISGVDIQNAEVVIEDNKVIYPEIYSGADLEFTVDSLGIRTEIVVKDKTSLKDKIEFDLLDCDPGDFKDAVMSDDDSSALVHEEVIIGEDGKKLILRPDYSKLGDIKGEVRIDPNIPIGTPSQDVFVTPSTNYGNRYMILVGKYTDCTIGCPVFWNSRGLIKFDFSLPGGAMVTSSVMSLYHYASNGPFDLTVSRATSGWNESTTFPGPDYEGNYGSAFIPVHNTNVSDDVAKRDISLNPNLIYQMNSSNNGLVLRPSGDPNTPGIAVCSRDSAYICLDQHDPELVIYYIVNQPPNPPNLDYPNQGWELGANEKRSSVTCDTSGTGAGCDVTFRVQTQDPDNTFPLSTFVRIRSSEGASRDFTQNQSGEGWFTRSRPLNDGHWNWRARTTDSYGDTGNWSVTKNFIVDTTAPSQPDMVVEPAFSPGLQNSITSTVSTDALIGEVRYNFEVSELPDFSEGESSGWVESESFTFASLENDKTYYYRVKAWDKLENETGWGTTTSSTQDAIPPDIQNINLDVSRISPSNQDGNFDSANIFFDVVETHWDENIVQILDTSNSVVREYTGLAQDANLNIDGQDGVGGWLPDGFYTLRLISRDLAGNQTTNDDSILVIDNTGALISISSPSDGAWFNINSTDISGITETDAILDITHLITFQYINATIDSDTGVFTENMNLLPGRNPIIFESTDIVNNENSLGVTYYREEENPVIDSVTPGLLINDRMTTVSVATHDVGFSDGTNDYISGIDPDETYISLFDSDNNEIVLVNNGTNVSTLGHINHTCGGSGTYGLSGPEDCTYSYVIDNELQPDGEYRIDTTIYDVAGNSIRSDSTTFELDSHTHNVVNEPTNGTLFNYSLITLEGEAERDSTIQITGAVDNESFVIDPTSTGGRITVENCRASSDPYHDGIKEICDWQVTEFQLDRDTTQDIAVSNPVTYEVTDIAGNVSTVNHTYKVNLYAVNLSLDTDINYFSPNGDGRQDGIEFIDLDTDGVVDIWEVRIRDSSNQIVRVLDGAGALPPNAYWDGKYVIGDPYADDGEYVPDGDYTYTLYMRSTDGIEFETNPVGIYAKTDLIDEVIITYPKNNSVTTRGVTNVQGQAPANTEVRICVDTIGLSGSCDFEYYSEVDGFGSFSAIVPLVRLDGQTQTEHFITATASDKYGNVTNPSNQVRVVVDTSDPFVSIAAIPALTGVNNEADYQVIIDKLNNGEPITQADLNALRTVILRSTVTQNTERVKLSFADFTSLSELPPSVAYSYLGYIDGNNQTHLYEPYEDGVNPVVSCSSTQCVWDFYYPVPPVNGGVYEIEFNGKKGETIQESYAAITIDGTIPLSPIILDINKIAGGESSNTNLFDDKYYSNSEVLEIIGGADPNTDIEVKDQNGNTICTTTTNAIGLFSCTTDISGIYPNVNTTEIELSLSTFASDGLNVVQSLEDVIAVVDKISPQIEDIIPDDQWQRSGDLVDIEVQADEQLAHAYLTTPEYAVYDFSLTTDLIGGLLGFPIHGLAPEGLYIVTISVGDLAGNSTNDIYAFYIDNTVPDEPDIDTATWGLFSGINYQSGFPAAGRLVPEYVTSDKKLTVYGLGEENSYLYFYIDNELAGVGQIGDRDTAICTQEGTDQVVDGVIVKSSYICVWAYEIEFEEEKGHILTTKVFDRAGNESLVSEDEILYYDITNPMQPETVSVSDSAHKPIIDWQYAKGTKVVSDKLGVGNFGKTPITNKTKVTVEGYAESLSDFEYFLYDPKGNQIDYQFLQNGGDGINKKSFSIGTKTGISQDGVYTFVTRNTDAAGNTSKLHTFQVERDTVAPNSPSVSLSPAASWSGIYMSIAGEPGSWPSIGGRLSSGGSTTLMVKRLSIWNDGDWERWYTFCSSLGDRAGNKSGASCDSIRTPVRPVRPGECDIQEDWFETGEDEETGETLYCYYDKSCDVDQLYDDNFSKSCKHYYGDMLKEKLNGEVLGAYDKVDAAVDDFNTKLDNVQYCVETYAEDACNKGSCDPEQAANHIITMCNVSGLVGDDISDDVESQLKSNFEAVREQYKRGDVDSCEWKLDFWNDGNCVAEYYKEGVHYVSEGLGYAAEVIWDATLITSPLLYIEAGVESLITGESFADMVDRNLEWVFDTGATSVQNGFSNGVKTVLHAIPALGKSIIDLQAHIYTEALPALITMPLNGQSFSENYEMYQQMTKDNLKWDTGDFGEDLLGVFNGAVTITAGIISAPIGGLGALIAADILGYVEGGISNYVDTGNWLSAEQTKQILCGNNEADLIECGAYHAGMYTAGKGIELGIKAITNGLSKIFGDAKDIPNPYGKKGGPEHQAAMNKIYDGLNKNSRGYEYQVKYKDGSTLPSGKSSRYVDVVEFDPKTGEPVKFYQVGKTNIDGTPIAREYQAILDIKSVYPKITIEFKSYNSPSLPSKIY